MYVSKEFALILKKKKNDKSKRTMSIALHDSKKYVKLLSIIIDIYTNNLSELKGSDCQKDRERVKKAVLVGMDIRQGFSHLGSRSFENRSRYEPSWFLVPSRKPCFRLTTSKKSTRQPRLGHFHASFFH